MFPKQYTRKSEPSCDKTVFGNRPSVDVIKMNSLGWTLKKRKYHMWTQIEPCEAAQVKEKIPSSPHNLSTSTRSQKRPERAVQSLVLLTL